MMPKAKQVDSCIQCQGDALLEVRKDAGELHAIMGLLSLEYFDKHKPGTTIKDYVSRLIDSHRRLKAIQANRLATAARKIKEANDLIASLRFIAEVCRNGSSGVHAGSSQITIGLDQILKTSIERIRSLVTTEQGLLSGHQADSEVDPLADLWVSK
jgi:hypothetical protein